MQAYSPFRIAAFFLTKAQQAGRSITPMKLIKLVYVAHAWSLALLKRPLISESVQAWKYGPVIQSLYHMFKTFGTSPIPDSQINLLPNDEIDVRTTALLEKVWEKYGHLSAVHLSALTHQPETPWDQVWKKYGENHKYVSIPDELIGDFYQKKLESHSGSGH